MKKLVALIGFTLLTTILFAQPPGGGDPEARKQRMKEMMIPQLVEKAKVSEKQADKIVDIMLESQQEAMKLRRDETLSDEDRQKKIKEINEARNTKIKEIPLTDEQFKAVKDLFEEMQKRRREGGGPGGQRGNF